MKGKRVLLGVTGGIAAYKAVEVVRLLSKAGADVQVMMTPAARRFVGELTFQALTRKAVPTTSLEPSASDRIEHIDLATWGDLLCIAPATANTIAKLANGLADNIITEVFLAFDGPVLVVPAMNDVMFQNRATQDNLQLLRNRGVEVLDPDVGELACGTSGPGRFAEPPVVVDTIASLLAPKDLRGKRVLVTAGPTREFIDAVRFISNPSTGRMGYAIAKVAAMRGAQVVLVSGPTELPVPLGVERVKAVSAQEMYEQVMAKAEWADVIVKSAAVADFRPASRSEAKLKKSQLKELSIPLQPNPDILKALGGRKGDKVLVGFAVESHDLVNNALDKLKRKNLDLIVANEAAEGFAKETNRAVIIRKDETLRTTSLMGKEDLAWVIMDEVVGLSG